MRDAAVQSQPNADAASDPYPRGVYADERFRVQGRILLFAVNHEGDVVDIDFARVGEEREKIVKMRAALNREFPAPRLRLVKAV